MYLKFSRVALVFACAVVCLALILAFMLTSTARIAHAETNDVETNNDIVVGTDKTTPDPWESLPEGENTVYYSDNSDLNNKFGFSEEGFKESSAITQSTDGNISITPLNLDGFLAGNIIGDAMMSNSGSMNEAQIQAFLKSRNSCNDTDLGKATPGIYYHVENGHFVCMADENFNGESAAHIIADVANAYNINPQVLIVTLQKEQSLITDTFPNADQYQKATGFGCPDTAPCDDKFAGLRIQLSSAANLYREVLNNGWTNYPVGYNNILWHKNPNCGTGVVNIENRATSSLYRYTPYQPNAAALAAGHGTGDSCSSYGNRNFYNYFTDWFGDTRTGGFSPEGALDVVKVDDDGTLHVRGWAVDRDNTDLSIDVHIYVGGPAGTGIGEGFVTTAKTSRPDVDEVLGYGTHHGFDFVIKPSIQGANIPIYAYGINIAGTPGKNRLIGHKTVQIGNSDHVAVWRAAKMEGGYFYTTNPDEYLIAINQGMRAEGLSLYTANANTPGAVPLWRAAKLNGAGYFYTTSWDEYLTTPNYNMRQEGLAFYVLPPGSPLSNDAVYRGAHLVNQGYIYTSNWDEYANALPANNYRQEGEVFRVW